MKTFRMLMGGLAAVLLVAACSGDDSTGPGDTGSDNEELVAGKPIKFTKLDVTKSNAKKGVTLIRTASEYKAFFGVKAPAGLFPKSWVLHYSMGTKSTGGYEVEPTQVNKTSTGGHKVKLSVTTHSPGAACLVPQMVTTPQVAVSFAAQSGVDTGVVELDAETDLCGGCNDVSDCPKIKMPCKTCDDGSKVCPQMTCDAGTCDLINTECPSAPAMCGGFANIQCPKGQTCVDNPNDSCDPNKGGADCSGICVTETKQICGGFAGLKCPSGQTCVDDPSDSCDPNKGGADCSGICVTKTPECTTAAQCKAPATAKICDDGTTVIAKATCDAGVCGIDFACPAPKMCGGFGNIKCDKGFYCGEDPNSECTKNGGADCSGICLKGEVCGNAICTAGTTCCNPLSSTCVKPGMVCAQ